MSYRLEGKDIVIGGFQNGIADDPYTGIADIRNANISSVPGECQVNYKTLLQSFASLSTVTISSADTGTEILTITSSPTLVSGMAITIAGTSLPTGITAGTIYWVTKVSNTQMKLSDSYPNYASSMFVDLTTAGTPGNWTFTTINVATPKFFVKDSTTNYWMLDSAGRTWLNGNGFNDIWIYTGNKVPSSSYTSGNGLIYYQGSDGTGWIIVIHNGSMDVTVSSPGSINWRYQWDIANGNFGAYSATPTNVLKSGNTTGLNHNAIVTPANQAIFVDSNWADRFYEVTGDVFDPDDPTSYIFDQTQLLPYTDVGQCLTYLGTDVLIGGKLNVIYIWNQFSSVSTNYIFLAESNVQQLVTVNTNTYIFVGNRGRIYITNGSNANPFKKIPDFISGTLDPQFTWYGAGFCKNVLYFGFAVMKNNPAPSGTDYITSLYKGLWGIDLNTNALFNANQLSGTNVHPTAIIAVYGTFNGALVGGQGLFIGWANGGNLQESTTSTGIDATASTPYASSETYVDTDMIPVGTYLKPFTASQVEWKTSYPIGVNGPGETIEIAYRTALNQSFATIGSTTVTASSMTTTVNGVTGNTTTVATTSGTGANQVAVADVYPVNFQKAQWVQLRVTMSSNATTPTFCRLTEIRIRDYPN